MALLGARLKANSAWASKSSHPFILFLIRTLSKVPKVLSVTSIWPSVWGASGVKLELSAHLPPQSEQKMAKKFAIPI